jgi:outer membrane protein assembly factor BamA
MTTRSQAKTFIRFVFLAASVLGMLAVGYSQTAQTVPDYPTRLPYRFNNFAWWGDAEIRALLKSRITGLGDEIAPNSAMEHKVRDALVIMLKEKGRVAEVQSQEPSNFSLAAERAPDSPAPAIVFSVVSPQILVDKVIVCQAPEALTSSLKQNLRRREGHEYSGGQDWMVRSNVKEELEAKGYLEGWVDITHDAPRRDGDHYLVNLLITVKSGSQYRIASITADGGPLLKGRDLSSHFAQKAGEIASAGPFGRLAGELRALYWHNGYADVEIHGPPVLDRSHAEVSYHLEVVPGPLYHLRSLTIHNLNAEQESKVRELLGIKSGDVFDQMAINGLYHKISADPDLAAYGFTFGPAKDKATTQVDLTLDFYKVGDKGSVSVK